MVVALLVIEHGAPLDRFLSHSQRDVNGAVEPRRCGLHRQFQRVEHAAGVAIGHFHEMVDRLRFNRHIEVTVAALAILKCCEEHAAQVLLRQRQQLKDAAAADERLIHLEVGVFGCRANKDDGAVLHPGEQRILL